MSLQHSLPFTDVLVRYSPRWGDDPRALTVLSWTVLLLVPLGLILWLSRYEMKLVPKATAFRLVGLRLLVLLLLVFLILGQPVVAWPVREKPREIVIVAVDRSGSLEVSDPHRPPLDKLRLAMALHMARDLVPDLQLQEWIDQGGTPAAITWVGDQEYPADRERRGRIEQERRGQYDEICKRVDALTRTAVARAILAPEGADLLKSLGERFQIEVVGFDRTARSYQPDHLDDLFRKSDDAHAADFTNISLPLSQALTHDSKASRVRAVILISDGQHNPPPEADADITPNALAADLGKQNIPVFPIGLGLKPQPPNKRSTAPPDVAVASVSAPDTVLKDAQTGKNSNVTVEAQIHVSELPPQDLDVELLLDGKVIEHRTIKHTDREDYPVTFSTSLTKEGTQKLTVRVAPVQGEGYRGNNERSALVKVVQDFSEVLLIDGESRWEHHYLAKALARDPMVKKLDRVVFEQPRLNPNLADAELQKVGYASRSLPDGADALTPYDCIVLGDVSPQELPLKGRKRLEDFVARRGGTLVIVAGKRSMPLGFAALANQEGETDPLLKLLPVKQPRAFVPAEGFALTLTDLGRKMPLLQMQGNPFLQTENELERPRPAAEIQRHYWAAVGEVKPGATVLAYAAQPPLLDPALRKKQQDSQGLIVRQSYGRGKVLYVGIDSTWRWRYKTGDRFHHYFWGQLVRWAAGDKLLEGGTPQLRFGSEHTQYEPGHEVHVMLRLGDEASRSKLAEPKMRVFRQKEDGEELVAVVPLHPRDGQPRVLEGRALGLPEGSYRLEPEAPELAKWLLAPTDPNAPQPHAAKFEVLTPQTKEMLALAPDFDQLEQLAIQSKSGGRVYTAEDARDIVKDLKKLEEKQAARPEIRLWEWWPVLVAVLLLLTLEWAGRKLAGLP